MDTDEWDLVSETSEQAPSSARNFDLEMRSGVERCMDQPTLMQWHRLVSKTSNTVNILQFLARNANPRKVAGMLANLGTSRGSLNQNCVICAKAIDLTLSELRGRGFCASSPPADLWRAKSTKPGTHLFLRDSPSVKTCRFASQVHPSPFVNIRIFNLIPPGKRAIVALPVRGRQFLHALNAMHLEDGTQFLIDGQSGALYERKDLVTAVQRFHFARQDAANDMLAAVYVTGDAPDFAASATTRPSLVGRSEDYLFPLDKL